MNTTVKGLPVPAALVPGGLNRTQTGSPQARPAAPQRSFTAPGNLQPMQMNRAPGAMSAQPHPSLMPPRANSLPPRNTHLDPASHNPAFNPFAGALLQQHQPPRRPAMPMPASHGYPGVSWSPMPQAPYSRPYAMPMPQPMPYRQPPAMQAASPFGQAMGPGQFAQGHRPLSQPAAPTFAAPPRRHSAPATTPAARPQAEATQPASPQKEKFSFSKAMFMSGYLSDRYGWGSSGSRVSARMSRYSENHSSGSSAVEHHSF